MKRSNELKKMPPKMLHDLEERGKEVTAGNVAYYTIL